MDAINNALTTWRQAQSLESINLILVAILLAIAFIWAGTVIRHADPLAKPKGAVLMLELFYTFIDDLVETTIGKRYPALKAYAATLFLFIISMNYSTLFGFTKAPTSNYNIPLGLVLITVVIIHGIGIHSNGVKDYFKEFLEPFAGMLPLHILDIFSKPVSMSFRLFGNITSGTMIMGLYYSTMLSVQDKILPFFGDVNVLGAIIAPPLHFYFDLFAGGIQAYVFTLLTLLFTALGMPDEKEN